MQASSTIFFCFVQSFMLVFFSFYAQKTFWKSAKKKWFFTHYFNVTKKANRFIWLTDSNIMSVSFHFTRSSSMYFFFKKWVVKFCMKRNEKEINCIIILVDFVAVFMIFIIESFILRACAMRLWKVFPF